MLENTCNHVAMHVLYNKPHTTSNSASRYIDFEIGHVASLWEDPLHITGLSSSKFIQIHPNCLPRYSSSIFSASKGFCCTVPSTASAAAASAVFRPPTTARTWPSNRAAGPGCCSSDSESKTNHVDTCGRRRWNFSHNALISNIATYNL